MNSYREKQYGWMLTLGILLLVPSLLWSGIRIYNSIIFDIEVTGHLKRAADANTINLAKQEMTVVIAFLEKEGLTNGYTSVIYRTPDEDIGFWYQSLKSSLEELKSVPSNATQLEKSNVLMKLRETLLDEGKSTSVTEPEGISIYPHNTLYFFFGWFSAFLFVGGVILIFIWSERR